MFEKTIYLLIGIDEYIYSDYIHIYNMLYKMEIYANIERILITQKANLSKILIIKT